MNEQLFANKARIYHNYRPSYPAGFIDYLYTIEDFSENSIIADIGSGTGIFSKLLLERGSCVYCVEPNDDMRSVAEKELSGFSGFVSINAPAEYTGLVKNSIDFVTTAQAFHWFNKDKFRYECCRILRSGGKVVIIWNSRDFSSEIVKADYETRKKYSIGEAKCISSAENPIYDVKGFFNDDKFEEMTFSNDLLLNRDTYIGMNLSRSYSPTEEKEPEKYLALVAALGEIYDNYNNDGILLYPHVSKVYIGAITAFS